jgi:hypothetical protein
VSPTQQPPQLVASQTQAPAEQCWPLTHATQAPPAVPQALSL